jgi:glycerol uptake facilitator-like aquaporin
LSGNAQLGPKLVAEFLGSLFLVVAAISPTILGYNVLKAGIPLSVFMDAVAVGFVLFALIEALGPISGCHINPAVTAAMVFAGEMDAKEGALYVVAQIAGGLCGTITSHLMFFHVVPVLFTISDVARPAGCYFAEFVGTLLLVVVIYCCMKSGSKLLGPAVGMLVGGFLITTSSTMFANPQVTIARIFTYAIAGIRPLDAAVFIVAEFLGGLAAAVLGRYLTRPLSPSVAER